MASRPPRNGLFQMHMNQKPKDPTQATKNGTNFQSKKTSILDDKMKLRNEAINEAKIRSNSITKNIMMKEGATTTAKKLPAMQRGRA